MTHELKLASQYYDDSASGVKTFEIRKNDRDYKVGDLIRLREWKDGKFTRRQHIRKITYILDDAEYLQDGYVCLGVDVVRDEAYEPIDCNDYTLARAERLAEYE